jgi:hypothetical protein
MNTALFPDGRVEDLSVVTDQYCLVQHDQAIWELFSSLKENVGIKQIDVKVMPNGGKVVAKFTTDVQVEVKKGDPVVYQALLINSADGTTSLNIQGGAWRLICSNGMVIPDSRVEQIGQRRLHKGTLSLEDEVSTFIKTMETSVESIGVWKEYTKKRLSTDEVEGIFEKLEIGPRVKEELLELELRGEGHSLGNLIQDKKVKAWDMYNAITQRITDSDSLESVKVKNTEKITKVFDSLVFE